MSGDNNNRSIHPRVWGSWDERGKRNTCAPKKKSTVERAIAGIKGHLERYPRDAMSQARLIKLTARLPSL